MITGALFFCYALLCLGRNFSPLIAPRKSHKLVTEGMYQYMRHPFYAGQIFLGLGWAAVSLSESRLLLALLLAVILDFKARQEEKKLIERYGGEYEKYMRTVNRFIPTLG